MCGIAGFMGDFEPRALAVALDAIRHRGPDDAGRFESAEARVGLGHTRLSILDLSPAGHQPMQDPATGVTIIFNGEIYNFRELRKSLEGAGVAFRGHSDTEVLLQVYLSDGQSLLEKLNGIFAFAIWDPRIGELFIARDAFGVKPLYLHEAPRGLAFASELKALLPFLGSTRQLDPVALHGYLGMLWCPGDGTPFRDVRKLGPGEALTVTGGRVRRRWTWAHSSAATTIPDDGMTEREAIDGVLSTLREAVRRQMVADVPVGAFLSGGLDSSAVVAFARELDPSIRCFTIRNPEGGDSGATDDLPYARCVARHLGVALDEVEVSADQLAAGFEDMVYQLDEPLADPAPLNVLHICRLARQGGIKVLLSGAGGDDLFTGYRRHRAVMLDAWLQRVPASLRRFAEHCLAGMDQRRPLVRKLSKYLNGSMLDGDHRLANYFRWFPESGIRALYTRDWASSLSDVSATDPLVACLAGLPSGMPALGKMLALEQRFFLADHNLIYTDKMSMAAGVEARVPFLDPDVASFAARIPFRLRQHGREGKWVLKRAMEAHLPHDVIYRPKAGFGAPVRRWMRRDLRPLVDDLLSDTSLRRRGIFDPGAVRRLRDADAAGRVDAAYTLFALLTVEVWCRRFVDRAA